MKKLFICILALVIAGFFTATVLAADYPSKPVTLIVPWTPGGSTDVTMRVLAETTSKYLGQPIIVENKPGAGGTLGPAIMAATAKPDGYTVSQMPTSVFRYPYMMKVNYDPIRDFSYIIQVTGYTFGVIVRKDAPWKNFKEFIAYAKANPGKVKYASPGASTAPHITMEKLAMQQGIKWIQVPMKGGVETTAAVLGGHVAAAADSTGWAPQVDSGDLRLLCTWGNKRTKRWPKVPTMKELGLGIVSNAPFGIAGPKGMDPKIVKKLHDAFKKGMEDPAFVKILEKMDMEDFYLGTKDYVQFVKEWCADEKEMVEKLGLKK